MRYLSFRIALLILLVLSSVNLPAQTPPVTIGVIADGRSVRIEESLEILKREIAVILEDEYSVIFPEEKMLYGDWTLSGISKLSDQLLADPDTDIVIALGFVCSQYIAGRTSFPKPTFASHVIDPVLQQLPFEKRIVDSLRPGEPEAFHVSGVPNLNYLRYSGGATDSMSRFKDIVPFSKAAVLVMEALTEAIPSVDSVVAQRARALQVETTIVPVADSVAETLARIPDDAEVVFVSPLLNLTSDQMAELIAGLNGLKLPSLSVQGRTEVERGMLVSIFATDDPVTRSRRIAVNIQEALNGSDPGEMATEFERDKGLVINMATAHLLGVSPRYTTLIEAELLNEGPQTFTRKLSLGAVVREARRVNLDLAAADKAVAAAEQSVNERRGPLLPQIELSGSASLIDDDRARTFPVVSETEFSATLAGHQSVYSDQAWANYSIEKSYRDLSLEERRELQLDVVLDAAVSYIDLLRSQTIERIQKENLKLTRNNLQLASSRVDIGAANRVELFRWESQIAANQRDVINAESYKKQARFAVNRILNRPQNESFDTVEATLNDPELVASLESLANYVDNPKGFALYSEFIVSEGLAASPEIKRLDASIQARNRDATAAKRSFFLPDVNLDAGVTSTDFRGVGSELPPGLNNTDWIVGMTATLPLFQGAGRIARVKRANRQVEELTLQREAVSQRVEQRIRSTLEAANASFLGIELSRAQSRAAKENFDLVKDSYAAGLVGILELLDAQNQSLVAELGAADTIFRYLIDLMRVQRSTGRFDYFRSSQERQDFLQKLNQFYTERGFIGSPQ